MNFLSVQFSTRFLFTPFAKVIIFRDSTPDSTVFNLHYSTFAHAIHFSNFCRSFTFFNEFAYLMYLLSIETLSHSSNRIVSHVHFTSDITFFSTSDNHFTNLFIIFWSNPSRTILVEIYFVSIGRYYIVISTARLDSLNST